MRKIPQIPQKNEKKGKARLEVFRVADIRSYIVDDKGRGYLCNDKLAKDLKRGYFVKVRMDGERIRKIIAIFG